MSRRYRNHDGYHEARRTRSVNMVQDLEYLSMFVERRLGHEAYEDWLQSVEGYGQMSLKQRLTVHGEKLAELRSKSAHFQNTSNLPD